MKTVTSTPVVPPLPDEQERRHGFLFHHDDGRGGALFVQGRDLKDAVTKYVAASREVVTGDPNTSQDFVAEIDLICLGQTLAAAGLMPGDDLAAVERGKPHFEDALLTAATTTAAVVLRWTDLDAWGDDGKRMNFESPAEAVDALKTALTHNGIHYSFAPGYQISIGGRPNPMFLLASKDGYEFQVMCWDRKPQADGSWYSIRIRMPGNGSVTIHGELKSPDAVVRWARQLLPVFLRNPKTCANYNRQRDASRNFWKDVTVPGFRIKPNRLADWWGLIWVA